MVVKLIKEQPGLTLGKCYYVIGIEADSYRIIDDSKDPCLYPPWKFDIIDPKRPSDWCVEHGESGEEYAYTCLLNRVGFFEDFHDGNPEAIKIFWDYIKSHDIDHK